MSPLPYCRDRGIIFRVSVMDKATLGTLQEQPSSGRSRRASPFSPLPPTHFSVGRSGGSTCCYVVMEQWLTQELVSSWGLSLLL